MRNYAVRVDNLGKQYRIIPRKGSKRRRGEMFIEYFSPFDYFRRSIRPPTEAETLWALRNVSFDIQQGESLGILGHNGAGKSTLLRILSRITLPTEGCAQVSGRVGSLLQIGTGFHPELTGRENIYLNGTILGMKKTEVDRKFDEIVSFSGVEKFIDTPIKRYSSGMTVRLGFSVAIFLEPDVLLVDEVLSVGDATFRLECLEKINHLIGEGKSVLFVSHDINTVQRLCERSIILESGRMVKDTRTSEIVERYMPKVTDDLAPREWLDLSKSTRQGLGEVRFSRIRYRSHNQTLNDYAYPDGSLEFLFEVHAHSAQDISGVAVTFFDRSGFRLINAGFYSSENSFSLDKGRNVIRLFIRSLHLKPGTYMLALWLASPPDIQHDNIPLAAHIKVISANQPGLDTADPYSDKVTSQVEVTKVMNLDNLRIGF